MRSRMSSRLRWATLIAATASIAFASPAAAIDPVTLEGVSSPTQVPQGATVTHTFTVTNNTVGCTFCDEVYGLDMLLLRTRNDKPVANPFLSVTSSVGACTIAPVDSFGYHDASCTFGPRHDMPATTTVVATIQANESFDDFAGLLSGGHSIMVVSNTATDVLFAPQVSGSAKIALKGLPDGCAANDLTLKAKAKGGDIGRFTATISGPRLSSRPSRP